MSLKHYLRPRYIATIWMWFALALASFLVFAFALRQNNLNMLTLRQNVLKVDEQNGDVETALQSLRQYVYTHINTNTASATGIKPSIQLKYRYDRLVAAEDARVKAVNDKIYTDAQNYCEQQNPNGLSGRGRVPCITEYVGSHGTKAQPIQDGLYKFDFVSPRWAPDIPGIAMLLFFLFTGLFLVGFLVERHHARRFN